MNKHRRSSDPTLSGTASASGEQPAPRRHARLVTVLLLLLWLAGFLFAARQPCLLENPTYVFLNNLLRDAAGGNALLRTAQGAPFRLTDGQTCPQALVPDTSVHVLVIGPDVSGANWDTLMIAGLDEVRGTIRLIGIPRDLYIDYAPEVLDRLSQVSPKLAASMPVRKINAAHGIGERIGYRKASPRLGSPALDFTADLIREVFGIRIDDTVTIRPDGLRRIVDHFGGVDVEVPYRMRYSDPAQGLVIDLQPGLRHLDGAMAEGFVRFRQGYQADGTFRSYGDLERKKNQAAFVKAFAAQHLTAGNLGRLSDIVLDTDPWMETSIRDSRRLSDYTRLGAAILAAGLFVETAEIPCENFTRGGIYFLRFAPAPAVTDK